ncbi:MAG TPA: Gfo/Idh/MocA family oxidoreductase [Vicinamibacterales bacterium]|nr:Gfo/Idh/MocA family oxidoreductase [Vicinamibacterales bacterium]
MSVRVAVIGVGHLGRHHARILATLPGATLAGVVDINEARAQEIAAKHGTRPFTDFRQVLDGVDAVCVAVPTERHLEIARPFLERGIATLVEKPIARSAREAGALLEAAASGGAILAAGHTERYNPAVQAALPLVTTPRFVEVHRLGVFPERSLDIDVVFDLMIHDLDIVAALVKSPVASVEAVGVPVLTPRVDIANARLRFESGCIANITASRISRDRVRKIRFFQPDAYISIDYAAKEVEAYRLARRGAERPAIEGGKLSVPQDEPLALELADFVAAARDKRPPMVTGEDGRRAVVLAEQIAGEIERA